MIKLDYGADERLCKVLYINGLEEAVWPLQGRDAVPVEDQIDEWREIAAHYRAEGEPFKAEMRNEMRWFERDTGALIG